APNSSITADAVSFDNGGTMTIACPYVVHGSTYAAYGSVLRFTGPVDVAGSDLLGFVNAGATFDFTAATLLTPLTFRNVVLGGSLLSSTALHITGTLTGSSGTLGGSGTVYLDGGTAANPNYLWNTLTLNTNLVNNGYTLAPGFLNAAASVA